MADEPSNAELGRRLDRLDGRLETLVQAMVTLAEHSLAIGHLEREVGEIKADLAHERRTREDGDDALDKRIDEADKSTGVNLRQTIYNGLIPTILLLVTLLFGFLQIKGGK